MSPPKNKNVRASVSCRNPLRPIPNLTTCPSSPDVREPISVVIPLDHLRKKGAMMQKANISHGKTKIDKMEGRRELPCVRRLWVFVRRVIQVRSNVISV
jgi:hypothetical protein